MSPASDSDEELQLEQNEESDDAGLLLEDNPEDEDDEDGLVLQDNEEEENIVHTDDDLPELEDNDGLNELQLEANDELQLEGCGQHRLAQPEPF